ncbi:MAG: hypothetical protein O2807_08810 [bacterium]|nr:hypothetical protein [bacterium]
MASSGTGRGTGLRCGNCQAPVAHRDPVCRSCGARLETALCGKCGHRGKREAFVHHRCPVCGHRWDLGEMVVLPLVVALVIIAMLYIYFSIPGLR